MSSAEAVWVRKCCLQRCDTFEQAPGVDRPPSSLLR
jgi:hypothetical protein